MPLENWPNTFHPPPTYGGSDVDPLRTIARTKILPALRLVARNEKAHQDLRAAALIAMAKLSHAPEDLAVLAEVLAKPKATTPVVLESAVFAHGLLRRTAASQQLTAKRLDALRAGLFKNFDDPTLPLRARGFAALALGLLGDQPSADAAATTAGLFTRLVAEPAELEPDVGLLVAIGLQLPVTVTDAQREILRTCVQKGRIGTRQVGRVQRIKAVESLGRVGNASDITLLTRAMHSRRAKPHRVGRAAAVALGHLGRRVGREDRVSIAKALVSVATRKHDPMTGQFALMALAELVLADVAQGRSDILRGTGAGATLLQLAAEGRWVQRPYAALALARVAHAIGDETVIPVHGEYRAEALHQLRAMLQSKKLGPRQRGGVVLALGHIEDWGSRKTLLDVLSSKDQDPELRARAALGIGWIERSLGDRVSPLSGIGRVRLASTEARVALRAALGRGPSRLLRREAAHAMAILQDPERVGLLTKRLATAPSVEARCDLLLALGSDPKEEAVPVLLTAMGDMKRSALERAVACAALGRMADPEVLPSLQRLHTGTEYHTLSKLLAEALSLL